MLEKPNIPDEHINACLRETYGLDVAQLTFLSLGADVNTAVYRADTGDGKRYFVKLRSGVFDEMTIIVPKLLHDQGIQQVIAPLPTQSGQLWTSLENFKLAVFPFVEGSNGYEIELTDQHWVEFGRALKAIHSAAILPAITSRIQRESFSSQWRESVKDFQRQAVETIFGDPVAAELAAFLRRQQAVINHLVQRATDLAAALQSQSPSFILCHADIHAGNVLIDANDHFYIVDWDTLIMAPVERDLMYVGGGQFLDTRSPEEEAALFYQGYGPAQTDSVALAYYRYERIVQDIAAYCEEILITSGDSADRANGLRQLMSQFEPNNVVEITFRSERTK